MEVNPCRPELTYLAFVDDHILFAESSLEQVGVTLACLDFFCDSSGGKVSNKKIRIFFSNNFNWRLREEISDTIGFQRTDDLGKYLGVKLHHERVFRNSYDHILERAQQRLSAWKAKNLSFAGRLMLAKSSLSALPLYTMQSDFIPRYVSNKLDQTCRNILWGDFESSWKVHWKAWSSLCKLKEK